MSPDDQRSTAALEVVVTDERGRRLRKPTLVRWLQAVAPARARGVLCVACVADPAMRRMNRQFAGHDYVTDVLSFPANDDESEVRGPKSEVKAAATSDIGRRTSDRQPAQRHLGDVVIATGRARRQAGEACHSLETELRILALHGLLHVLGYDHARDAGQMARLESRLRRKGGLGVGLIERANRGRGEGRDKRATSFKKPESRKPRAESRRGRA